MVMLGFIGYVSDCWILGHNIKLYNGNIHLSTTVFGISKRLTPVWGSMKSFLTWCGLWCHSKSWKKTNNKQHCSHADCKDRQLQYAVREKGCCPFPGPLVICSTPPPPPTQTHMYTHTFGQQSSVGHCLPFTVYILTHALHHPFQSPHINFFYYHSRRKTNIENGRLRKKDQQSKKTNVLWTYLHLLSTSHQPHCKGWISDFT